ncbi:hypothetical protein C5F49_01935 [Nitrosopumilus oxyclinae]|uniref:ORC1-type DNA replication protein n=1 Tax=Nitrosopumilus oxyclinae TaxID=1959104 RepID=A0A7D5M423_9ARCH|nr:AAA family ATPase [Nitrosopumilus oxyclinae]QLH04207.1 hypothetical protein C5F49_01935 [Nitrosopumilus oxyclinae]
MFLVEQMHKRKFQKLLKKEIDRMTAFKDQSYFDTLSAPKKILGREDKIQELLGMIVGYKKNFVPPLVSVYGRSGSGKSTLVKFVLDNLPDISTCIVNLRKSKTIFGASNLILEELQGKTITNSNGLNKAIENVESAIVQKLEHEKKNTLFILLDEADSILNDKRGNPSDFFYKLLTIIEDLKKQNYLVSIITISNNLFDQYNLDDRVKSRIGNNHILFDPYSKDEIVDILKEISDKALHEKVDLPILQQCAHLSSSIHGDARRAIDLLHSAAKLAIKENQPISKDHVAQANDLLDSDFVLQFLKTAPYHMKVICYVIGQSTFVSGKQWHYTSAIEKVYSNVLPEDKKNLGYRRVSDLLNELAQAGILESSTKTLGRYGSGKMYRLKFPADIIGKYFPEKFVLWEQMKNEYYSVNHDPDVKYNRDPRLKFDRFEGIKKYQELLGQF